MSAFQVAIHGPVMPLIRDGLSRRLPTHLLWEKPDLATFLKDQGAGIRALVGGFRTRIDASELDRFPNLKIISNFGVGYDMVDAAAAAERGIVVTNTPDVLNEEVADTAIGLLLMTVRKLPQAERYLRAGRWEKEGNYPLTASLRGRSMGIVGLGRIGKAIARRAEAFGLKLAYYGRTRQADVAYPFYSDLVAMARDVDILMLILPGGAATYRLVDAAVLDALGPDGILINVARGTVVDEPALLAALQGNRILGAGLDVFEHEPKVPAAFFDLDNVVLLPHVGSASRHTRDLMGRLVVDNVLAIAEGRPPLTPVAETPWPLSKG
ncbi:MAG TPA: 2-hydroxyacid dehydrogenase [Beijerinckiaceae bacterium]|nr:2-hydroxyacid dehydrogenase [Beijerinckiaceae bacterium]